MIRQPLQVYEFGPFRLVPRERQLLRDGQPVALTAKVFDLLVALVENSGRLVTKEELLQRIWPDCFVEEANLSVNMSTLRRALGEEASRCRYVETVPRHGYRFVGKVEELWEEPSEPAPDNPAPEATAAVETARGRPAAVPARLRLWAGALVAVGLIVALLLWLGRGRREVGAGGGTSAIQAVAVLPLENLSGDPAQDYFADGLTGALINDLAKVSSLRVMARSAVMQYRRSRKPPAEIGAELKVDAVLTGSVARSGERVRIAVRLLQVGSERSLWTGTYEQNLRDVLALQRAVTQDIAGEIRVNLTPQEQREFGRVGRVNPEAYDHYLRGQFYLQRQSRESNQSAIAALERAIAADPSFAAAQAELAQAYVWKLFLFAPRDQQWAEKAYVAAEKALALDPNSAEAHLARGRLLWTPRNNFPHEKAIREYRRALALNPNLDEARNQLALVYCHIGAFDEALRESDLAVTTNPTNALAQFRTGQTLNFQGKYEQALGVLRALPQEVNASLVGHQIAWALFNLGRKDEAAALLEQLLRDTPEDPGGVFTSVQAVLAASAGQNSLAEEKILAAIRKGKGFGHFHHTAYHIGCAYALMKKPDAALRWLEAAATDGFPCYPLFANDRNLDSVRGDARFAVLLSRLRRQWEHFRRIV